MGRKLKLLVKGQLVTSWTQCLIFNGHRCSVIAAPSPESLVPRRDCSYIAVVDMSGRLLLR